MNKLDAILKLAAGVFAGAVVPGLVFAIAMVSEPIIISDAVKGAELTRNLLLINSKGEEAAYNLRAEGQIADWTAFYRPGDKEFSEPISEITVGTDSRENVTVKFLVPEDAPNDTYTGLISITEAATNPLRGRVTTSVNLVVDREVSITVTDEEKIELTATIAPLEQEVLAGDLLKLKVVYDNKGNVAVKPDAQLRIVNTETNAILHNAIYPYSGGAPVRAHERKDMGALLEWSSAGKPPGRYEAQIDILLSGNPVYNQKIGFTVTNKPLGSMAANLSSLNIGVSEKFWFVLGVIILLAAGLVSAITKRRASRTTG